MKKLYHSSCNFLGDGHEKSGAVKDTYSSIVSYHFNDVFVWFVIITGQIVGPLFTACMLLSLLLLIVYSHHIK